MENKKKQSRSILSKKSNKKLNIENDSEVYDRLIDEANYKTGFLRNKNDVWQFCFI